MTDKNEYFNEEEIQAFRKLLASIDTVYTWQKELVDLLVKDDRFGIRTDGAIRMLNDQLDGTKLKNCLNDLYDSAVMDILVKEAKLAMNDPEKNFGNQPEFDDDLWF